MSRVGVDLILPPLIQGIPLFHISSTSVHGFIPAHAGNTSLQRNRPWPWKVHPRSRGEYLLNASRFLTPLGSPPLTRGIPCFLLACSSARGFTPAHAGNTLHGSHQTAYRRVHPRSRGEYPYSDLTHHQLQGSPPLTRGIRSSRTIQMWNRRFTPAHAGNTPVRFPSIVHPQVHPRSRGEYADTRSVWNFCPGSPPLTRGIPIIKIV